MGDPLLYAFICILLRNNSFTSFEEGSKPNRRTVKTEWDGNSLANFSSYEAPILGNQSATT